jgi:hypothetical protein
MTWHPFPFLLNGEFAERVMRQVHTNTISLRTASRTTHFLGAFLDCAQCEKVLQKATHFVIARCARPVRYLLSECAPALAASAAQTFTWVPAR